MPKSLLLIFVKNPTLGKVKTRLAATIGDQKALQVYELLLSRTLEITQNLKIDKAIYYAEEVIDQDRWPNNIFQKYAQTGESLGERMANAFATSFEKGYERVGIIGSDCYELTAEYIQEGFKQLNQHDVVIGPSTDGGYYFLGMSGYYASLFQDINWSTEVVLQQTLEKAKQLDLTHALLPALTDIDEEKDLKTIPNFSLQQLN